MALQEMLKDDIELEHIRLMVKLIFDLSRA